MWLTQIKCTFTRWNYYTCFSNISKWWCSWQWNSDASNIRIRIMRKLYLLNHLPSCSPLYACPCVLICFSREPVFLTLRPSNCWQVHVSFVKCSGSLKGVEGHLRGAAVTFLLVVQAPKAWEPSYDHLDQYYYFYLFSFLSFCLSYFWPKKVSGAPKL